MDGNRDTSQERALAPRKPTVVWQGQGSVSLFDAGKASPGVVLHLHVESSIQERRGPVVVYPEEGHKNDPMDGTLLL